MLGDFLNYAPIMGFLKRADLAGASVLEVGGQGRLGFFHGAAMAGADRRFTGALPPSLVAVNADLLALPFQDGAVRVVVRADLACSDSDEELDGALGEMLRVSAEWVLCGCDGRQSVAMEQLTGSGGQWEFMSAAAGHPLWVQAARLLDRTPGAGEQARVSLQAERARWQELAGQLSFGGGDRVLCILHRSNAAPALLGAPLVETVPGCIDAAGWLAPALRCPRCGEGAMEPTNQPVMPLACAACGALYLAGPRGELDLRRPSDSSSISMKGPTPLDVSVVIPVYGQAELTRGCLESIFAHPPGCSIEVIVVDNASPPSVARVLEPFSGRIRVIRNDANLGFARACNQGAQGALGRHVLFLNNDIEVHAGWLDPLVAVLDRNPFAGAAGSLLLYPGGKVQHAGIVFCRERTGRPAVVPYHFHSGSEPTSPWVTRPRELQAVTGACMLVRRDLFELLDGFDAGYWNGLEDVDLCLRLGECGFKVFYEPGSVLTHHESAAGPERWSGLVRNLERFDARWGARVSPDDTEQCLEDGMLPVWAPSAHGPQREAIRAPMTTVVLHAQGMNARTLEKWVRRIPLPPSPPVEWIVTGSEELAGSGPAEVDGNPIRYVSAEPVRGGAYAANLALRAATGAVTILLEPRVHLGEGWLTGILEGIGGLPDVGAAGLRAGEGRLLSGCVALRRELFERLGDLDEDLDAPFVTDDLCLRCHEAGFRVAYLQGGAEMAGTPARPAEGLLTFERKWGLSPADYFERGIRPIRRISEEPEAGREEVRQALDETLHAVRAGQFETAAAAAARAQMLDPAHPEAYLLMGLASLRRGDPGAAQEAFDLAARLAPWSARHVQPLAELLRSHGHPGAALELYQRLLKMRRRDPVVLTGMAECLLAVGEIQMARECMVLARALSTQPGAQPAPGAPAIPGGTEEALAG